MSLACHRLISTSQKWLRQFFLVHNKQRHKGEVHNLLKFTETHDLKLMVSASSFPNHSSILLRPYLHIHVYRCLLTYMHGVFIKALNTYMDNAKKTYLWWMKTPINLALYTLYRIGTINNTDEGDLLDNWGLLKLMIIYYILMTFVFD